MSVQKNKYQDYETFTSPSKKSEANDRHSLKPSKNLQNEAEPTETLKNHCREIEKVEAQPELSSKAPAATAPLAAATEDVAVAVNNILKSEAPARPEELPYAEKQKVIKKRKAIEKDRRLLSNDRWLARNGHSLTYAGIFLFTLVVYFRPYELIPALSGLSSIAMFIAIATILIYLPTQFSTEGNLTTLSTEVKCVLLMASWALLTIPIAKDPGLAWETFNDTFSKVVMIFVMMVNTLRTKARLKGLMWLSIGIGVMLSYQALVLYQKGEFKTEGYRVSVDFGGMFGNANDMALHLVIFIPIAVVLGIASANKLAKLMYFTAAGMMVVANMVTQSRGGFLGLIAIAVVLVWKLSKRRRLPVVLTSAVVGTIVVLLAPGNYGLRILSIFIPGLDAAGSSDQRKELLEQSIYVTLRNPQGIGIGNFPVVGIRNLQTHNAYTQVSSELGWLAAVAYVILIVSPLRKLAAIERQLFAREDFSWTYYLSIGIQASIIGYMVSSFFGPVAYNWFIYYPIAYAVCLRRMYQTSEMKKGEPIEKEGSLSDYFKLQKAGL